MTAQHAVLVVVVVAGIGLCLLPGVSKRLAVGVGALMVALSTLAAAFGLDEASSSLAEVAYYCIVIALVSAALAWGGPRLAGRTRRILVRRTGGGPS